jgi:hypothetical protein
MNTSNLILIDSIVIITLCLFGVLLPKLFKDEDVIYGMNAINVAFAIGFLFNLATLSSAFCLSYIKSIGSAFGFCLSITNHPSLGFDLPSHSMLDKDQ